MFLLLMMMSFILMAIDLSFIENSEDPNYGHFWESMSRIWEIKEFFSES